MLPLKSALIFKFQPTKGASEITAEKMRFSRFNFSQKIAKMHIFSRKNDQFYKKIAKSHFRIFESSLCLVLRFFGKIASFC